MSDWKDWLRSEWTAGYVSVMAAIVAFCFCAVLVTSCERHREDVNARAGQTSTVPSIP